MSKPAPQSKKVLIFLALPLILLAGMAFGYMKTNVATERNIIIAATEGDAASVETLLAMGAPKEARDPFSGCTPLILAAAGNENHAIPVIETLLKYGADINAKSRSGNTALIVATQRNRADVVQFLLRNGADINHVSDVGRSALYWAEKKATGK